MKLNCRAWMKIGERPSRGGEYRPITPKAKRNARKPEYYQMLTEILKGLP